MSITDELRKYADRLSDEAARKSEHGFSPVAMKLEGIADRIDAEHESACAEAYGNGVQSVALPDLTAYVKLPVDAEGKPIRIGDVMEGVDKYDSLKKVMGKVITVSFEADGLVDVAVQAWNGDGKSWRRAYLDPDASVYRHHHAPTVEDVLRDVVTLCHNTWKEESPFHFYDVDDVMKSGNIAEYASRLRLAGDAE